MVVSGSGELIQVAVIPKPLVKVFALYVQSSPQVNFVLVEKGITGIGFAHKLVDIIVDIVTPAKSQNR